jgi:hypothetical protein
VLFRFQAQSVERRQLMRYLTASLVVVAAGLACWALTPVSADGVIPLDRYVGCGHVINSANCDGCTDHADDCSCSPLAQCVSNHTVCSTAGRAFEEDPEGVKVWKHKRPCSKRYQCNNDSGEDHGSCSGSGHCATSQEWVYSLMDQGWEYYEDGTCGTR